MPRDGKLHDFDYSKPVRTALRTRAISPLGKLRMLPLAAMLLKNLKHLGYSDYTGIAAVDTETTQSYSRRALTSELEQYATEPLVRGTWAADDGESSNALMLWSVKNMLAPTVWSLDSGMDALARNIAGRVEVRYGQAVENVTDEGTRVDVTTGGRTESFDGAIIATTAGPALSMFPQMDANHRTLYENARYRGLITVALGLDRPPQDKATYILLPRVEDPDVIAIIADHHKAIGRAPAGKSMYTLLFSHEYLHRTRDYSEERIIDEAIACASRYHGDISGAVEQTQVVRWDEVVPVVGQGAFKRIADFQNRLDATARVQFASDLDRIPGVNGALVSGLEAAKRVVRGRSSSKRPALAAR
jgi:oxygen-dependent protoporphyrinogen oxidase